MIPFGTIILLFIINDTKINIYSRPEFEKESNDKEIKFNIKTPNKPEIIESLENSQLLKYELYENERWWMFVGWTKNLIGNERPIWSDISGKNYLDFKSVFLPGEEYEWVDDWKKEINENTDNEGWEYSSDFNSKFSPSTFQKYVRRRKYIRYAKHI